MTPFNVRSVSVLSATIVVTAAQAVAQCQTWQQVASGFPNNAVFALLSTGSRIIAGGTMDGPGIYRVAQYNHVSPGVGWQPVGGALSGGSATPAVNALTLYNGEVIAGGTFSTSASGAVNRIARCNVLAGTSWQALGSGMDAAASVNALAVFGNELIAGGVIATAGGTAVSNIARWNGTSWQGLGQGIQGTIFALAVLGSELIAGGSFTSAGGNAANCIARWDGTSWQPLGSGMNGQVLAMAVFEGELIAAGDFTAAGGVSANRIARWNGLAWQSMGSGVDGTVLSLLAHAGVLFVGGDFLTAGGNSAVRMAIWDGSAWRGSAWLGLPGGMNNTVYSLTASAQDGSLIAGGSFTSVNALPGLRVAWLRQLVTKHPADQIAGAGQPFSLTATALGAVTYQWRKGGVPLVDGGTLSGATTGTLSISAAAASDFGAYDVIVSNGCSVTSNPAAVAVLGGDPACPADIVPPGGDGAVNVSDLLAVIGAWGACP